MRGQYLDFVKIEDENIVHQNILREISESTPYLGNLTHYINKNIDNQIAGNDYLVKSQEGIIGYVGLSGKIETIHGKTVSIYHAILKQFYGKGYGKLILNEISLILKTQDDVDLIIANVDSTNVYGLKTIEAAEFKPILELSDEEETQFHKYLK